MSETASAAAPSAVDAPVQSPAPETLQAPTQTSGQEQQTQEGLKVSEGASALTDGVGAEPAQETAPEEKPAEEAPAGEPEPLKYEDFKLPEGLAKDDKLLTAFIENAAKHHVSQDAAQAVIDAIAPQVSEALSAPYKEWEARQTAWLDEINKDPEIGGAKLKPVQAQIGKLLVDTALIDPGFQQAMIETGAGNHPAVVRTFAKLAAAYTEGRPSPVGRPAEQPRTLAQKLYPNLPPR